jgi:hypothetical protein
VAILKRQLHLWHRWLGIVLGLLVLLWFGSGVVMMYVPYPALTQDERMARLAPLDAAAVRFSAAQAWQASGRQGMPVSVRLNTVAGRPAYHFRAGDGAGSALVSVWADNGARLAVGATLAAASARRGAGAVSPTVERIDLDQWSFGRIAVHRPLYRVALGDAEGSVHYVSGRTGELVRDTTRSERAWNWAGSVIHWLYFTPLRAEGGLWRQAVMWSSGVALALALTGMVVGIQRLRLRRRYAGGRRSPYQGWQAWHHWLGLGAGTLTLTWLFSGWLSVTPFGWLDSPGITDADRLAFAGGPLQEADLVLDAAAMLRAHAGVLELEWRRVGGKLYLAALERGAPRLLDAQDGQAGGALPPARLLEAARAVRPGVPVLEAVMLASEDGYYYSHHHRQALPVLRVRFRDPAGTTLYADPASGQLAGYADRHSKWRRWLFNGLHQLDFVRARPAWDVLVASLCGLGALLATSGLVLGWRRLRR